VLPCAVLLLYSDVGGNNLIAEGDAATAFGNATRLKLSRLHLPVSSAPPLCCGLPLALHLSPPRPAHCTPVNPDLPG